MVEINTHCNVLVDGKFLVIALFQLHSFRIQSILWCNFRVSVFFPIVTI